MEQKTVIIKNVDMDIVELLRDIRLDERRQLSAILADAIQCYADSQEDYDWDDEPVDALAA